MDSPIVGGALRTVANGGGRVLYESGAAYAESGAFETERRFLQDYFGLSVQFPRELWPAPGSGSPPYVHYRWPSPVMIRDFSRVVTVSRELTSSLHIAKIETATVACRCPVGKGEFIFLGSPLGPHLSFGDAEAQRLLNAFVFAERDLKI